MKPFIEVLVGGIYDSDILRFETKAQIPLRVLGALGGSNKSKSYRISILAQSASESLSQLRSAAAAELGALLWTFSTEISSLYLQSVG